MRSPVAQRSLPTQFHLLMFSIYRDIDAKTAELSFGIPCTYENLNELGKCGVILSVV